jgi:undecaprenyl-diphosphatase
VPAPVLRWTAAGLLAAFAATAVLVEVTGDLPGDGVLVRPPSQGRGRALALAVDALTGYEGVAVATGLLVVLLARLGRRHDALLCAVSVGGALVGNALLKRLVGRPRPELLPMDVAVSPSSFPSGHAAATAALVVAAVLVLRGTRARVPVAVAGALLVVGTAGSQLLLALHRPSDLLGGWLWAAAWTTAVWAVLDRRRPP